MWYVFGTQIIIRLKINITVRVTSAPMKRIMTTFFRESSLFLLPLNIKNLNYNMQPIQLDMNLNYNMQPIQLEMNLNYNMQPIQLEMILYHKRNMSKTNFIFMIQGKRDKIMHYKFYKTKEKRVIVNSVYNVVKF